VENVPMQLCRILRFCACHEQMHYGIRVAMYIEIVPNRTHPPAIPDGGFFGFQENSLIGA